MLFFAGCRKPLAPNTDRNEAPETWITAAPQDTLTPRDALGNPISPNPVSPSSIAFRFHIYWAGGDQDGAVVGYYIAVTDTVPTPGLGEPQLPGPKPSDYHFTTRTDSTIVFTVFRDRADRRHGFYVYAVDDKGRSDATPARFILNAVDQYPPVPVIDVAEATAEIYDIRDLIPGVPLPKRLYTKAIDDTFRITNPTPGDTIPIGSTLRFKWHADQRVARNPAVAYEYKFDEPVFVHVDATVDSAVYPPSAVTAGTKVFTLLALDQAGGARTSPTTTRYFQVNLAPDSWFAGPNPTPATNPGYYSVDRIGRFRAIPDWTSGAIGPLAFPGSYFNPDSVAILPKDRLPRRTFFEIYGDRVYVRSEGDTVNMNSIIMITGGGFDADSPYAVRVSGFAVDTTLGPVFHKRPANGSPIGFKIFVPVYLYPSNAPSGFPQSTMFPLDEALLVPDPKINGYLSMQQSGIAFATIRAQDGNNQVDNRLPFNLKAFADSADTGLLDGRPARKALRDRVIKFYVNRAPYFLHDVNSSLPRPVPTTSPTRAISMGLSAATDDDPYDSDQRAPGGQPASSPTPPSLRYTVFVRGKNAADRDTTYLPPVGYSRTSSPPTSITVPDFIVGTNVAIVIELCDFPTDQYVDGRGRCRTYSYDVTVPPPSVSASAPAQATTPRPGGSDWNSRSTRR